MFLSAKTLFSLNPPLNGKGPFDLPQQRQTGFMDWLIELSTMASDRCFSVFGHQFQGHLATGSATYRRKELSLIAGKAVSFSWQ